MISYYSQDERACGEDVEWACGPVTLANSLILLGLASYHHQVPPSSIIQRVKSGKGPKEVKKRVGMAPYELRDLAMLFVEPELVATLQHPCSVDDLRRGDLIYVNSIALKNAQGGVQYEDSVVDSHIVLVERVSSEGVFVINPDCRRSGTGFQHNKWGRMVIKIDLLEQVWQSTREDGSTTVRAAVLLRPSTAAGPPSSLSLSPH
jgi:hypothetical protein